MGRLIDADELIKGLKEDYDDCDIQNALEFFGIYDYIDSRPATYDIENVQNETREYFKNKINNANTSKTTDGWDLVEFNADIHNIIGKGGVE